jgi:diaminohydroxyphosphoribosylaminopyrimidine deaminase/5-amino-6-(5-phosphoribosylamino)uracil reductase
VTFDEQMIQRCLELAQRGAGHTAPNPMVGCVVVHQNKIVAEGWHHACGMPHAEPDALGQLHDADILKECTLYVNLEPCSHQGKTPPCADLIIIKGIKRVVIGNRDSNQLVNGSGISKLLSNGVEVSTGIMEKEAYELNRRFFCYHENRRPYIILKWACTADGFMAPANRKRTQISGEAAAKLLHRWRSEESAVLIGRGTAQHDKPQLNTRLSPGKDPLRIVIDPQLQAPALEGNQETLVFNCVKNGSEDHVQYVLYDKNKGLSDIIATLHQRQILSVLVEGGPFTLQQFLHAGLFDEIRVIQSKNKWLHDGLKAPKVNLLPVFTEETADDTIHYYRRDMK